MIHLSYIFVSIFCIVFNTANSQWLDNTFELYILLVWFVSCLILLTFNSFMIHLSSIINLFVWFVSCLTLQTFSRLMIHLSSIFC